MPVKDSSCRTIKHQREQPPCSSTTPSERFSKRTDTDALRRAYTTADAHAKYLRSRIRASSDHPNPCAFCFDTENHCLPPSVEQTHRWAVHMQTKDFNQRRTPRRMNRMRARANTRSLTGKRRTNLPHAVGTSFRSLSRALPPFFLLHFNPPSVRLMLSAESSDLLLSVSDRRSSGGAFWFRVVIPHTLKVGAYDADAGSCW